MNLTILLLSEGHFSIATPLNIYSCTARVPGSYQMPAGINHRIKDKDTTHVYAIPTKIYKKNWNSFWLEPQMAILIVLTERERVTRQGSLLVQLTVHTLLTVYILAQVYWYILCTGILSQEEITKIFQHD